MPLLTGSIKNIATLIIGIVFIVSISQDSYAQLEVTDTMSDQNLAKSLAGKGVTISNVSVNCPPGPDGAAYGFFDAGNANLNLARGLIMTTGAISNALGPNDKGAVSTNNGSPGDSDLDQIKSPTSDACVFEFDIKPSGDSLKFNYSFASEEYPEFAPPNNSSGFEDVFAFFISGPRPGGGVYNNKNIALVPGTTTPVSIDNVNPVNNSQYYIDNGDGTTSPQNTDPNFIQYDGFTDGLFVAENVIPCQTYHLKLAVADVDDDIWDTGVFVGAESVVSKNINVTGGTLGGTIFKNAVEGCIDGQFTFTLDRAVNDTTIVNYTIQGDATNGVDYASIPDSVIILPGDTLEQITIDAFADGISEPYETVELIVINNCTNAGFDTASIQIQDSVGVSTGKPDSLTICEGGFVQFQASGGLSFNWTPSAGLSTTTGPNPVATPDVSTTYVVSTQLGNCVDSDSTHITVIPTNFSVNLEPDTNICQNQSIQLQPNVQPPGNYSYSWRPAASLSDSSVASPIASPSDSTTYIVRVSSNQCFIEDTIDVNVVGTGINISAQADQDTVCPGGTVQLSLPGNSSGCGTNNTSCSGAIDSTTIGTSSATTSLGTPFKGFFEDSRVQYIFRASELQALGVDQGVIEEIAFDVASKNSNRPYNNFTIKIGCTSLSDFSSRNDFVSGLDVVYTPKSVSSSGGWNNFVLDNEYDWDGSSNLIVEVCYDNATFSNDDDIRYTSTSYSSVMYNFADNQSGCNLTASSSPNFNKTGNRPNIRLGVCSNDLSNAQISWRPAALVDSPNARTTTATVFQTTTFWVAVDNGTGCFSTSNVEVATDTSLSVQAVPDTTICAGKSIQLNATPQGTPKPMPLNCGANGTSCQSPTTKQVGSGNNPRTSPTPYVGNSAGGTKARMQFIYQASDLNAQGVTSGSIASIGFDVSTDQSPDSFRNMTIRVGCTSKDSFSNPDSYITGLTTVYNTPAFSTSNGWNTHQLDNTYDWDGSSNLVVEVCYAASANGLSAGGGSDFVNTTSTGYNAVMFRSDQSASGPGCSMNYNNASTLINDARPNVQFGMCDPPPGDFSFSWSPGNALDSTNVQSPIATPFNSKDYVVTVTDGECTVRDTASITITQAFNLNVSGVNIGCNGNQFGTVWASASGGSAPYSFEWSNGATTDTITNLPADNYIVTVTDGSGCKAIDSFRVQQTTPLTIDSMIKQDIACFGDSSGFAKAEFSGGIAPYTLQWSTGDTTASIDNLPADTFSLSINDVGGCSASDTVIIQQPSPLTATIDSFADPTCFDTQDGVARVSPSGGRMPYSYQWDDSLGQTTQQATGLAGGQYSVTVTDDSGCVAVDSILLEEPDTFQINLTVQQPIRCYGDSNGAIAASVSGDTSQHSFSWANQNGPIANGLQVGKHTVTVTTDSSGCQQTASLFLSQPDSIAISITNSDVLCHGDSSGSASVVASGDNGPPFSFNWSTGDTSQSINGLSVGTYQVSVTDTNGCTNSQQFAIAEPSALQLSTTSNPLTCSDLSDGSATANVTGGVSPYSYRWNDADSQATATAQSLPSGTFIVTVSDQNGCTVEDSAIIAKPAPLGFQQIDVIDESCPGAKDGAIFAKAEGGSEPYNYTLQGSMESTEGAFNGLAGGQELKLTVEDQKNCKTDTSLRIEPPQEVLINFPKDKITIEVGNSHRLQPIVLPDTNSGYEFVWQPTTGLSCIDCQTPVASPFKQTNYTLTVIDDNQCRYSENILVDVVNPEHLFVPNAFTPDGNERNDEFRVYGSAINRVDLKVFNRWGELVFETQKVSKGWDGTRDGEALPPGVYIYHVIVEYIDGQTVQKQGSVTLIR